MKLTDFARASEQDYRWLQQKVDGLPAGQALKFENCEMPGDCLPAQTTVCLYKDSDHYAMFFEGPIQYSGDNQAMAALSNGSRLLFRSFRKMKEFFQTLPPESVIASPSQITASESAPDHFDLNSVINKDQLFLLQHEISSVIDYRIIQHELEKHIIGQEKAVQTIAHQVSLHLNKRVPRKPLSIIAYGPPGTGKSEAAKALPKILSRFCPHNYATVWTELNTFSEAHSVYRLTGSPPGYVGYDDAPVFEAVTRNLYTIFLFDELDKAHPEVLKTFMSILDEGRCAARKELPDHSREYNFRHCIFIFTSNFRLGQESQRKTGFAFTPDIENICYENDAVEVSYREMASENESVSLTKQIYRETEAARKSFTEAGILPEIASRFNCFVAFQELSDNAKAKILAKQVIETGFEYGIQIVHIATPIMQSLIEASMSEDILTVRSFKSVIEGHLGDVFAQTGALHENQKVRLEGTIDMPELIQE